MAMSDADLNAVWGPSGLSEPYTLQRQNMYANMILSQWGMPYETRSLSDDHLRLLVREFLVDARTSSDLLMRGFR
jgi:hypothetical protein